MVVLQDWTSQARTHHAMGGHSGICGRADQKRIQHSLKLAGFFPKRSGLLFVADCLFQQGVAADRVGKVERRRFRACAIDFERLDVAGLRELKASLIQMNVARVTDGVGEHEWDIRCAINRSDFLIVPQRFIHVVQIAFNLSQRGQRLGQLYWILSLAGKRNGFNQVLSGAIWIVKPGMARQDQQIVNGGGHNMKLSPIFVSTGWLYALVMK